jgi:transcriptional regulator GlxA family with amidase domain
MIGDWGTIPLWKELQAHPGFAPLFILEPNLRHHQKGRGVLHLGPEQLASALEIARRLSDALRQNGPPYAVVAAIQLLDLVALFCECYCVARNREHRMILKMERVIKHLQAHWQQQPDFKALAAMINVSVPTFYRTFRAATGKTPAGYVNGLRIEKACHLLRTTDSTITNIAFDVGFNDSNYFSRLFQRRKGSSPRDYRKALPQAGRERLSFLQ